jgi:redox-sensitive bicupin YhaK (pirin superfamily)
MSLKIIRRSDERGHDKYGGWLDTRYTFSFAEYYDPQFNGFSCLRVINEDHIAASSGFPLHSHRNMEIITYLVSGKLEHKDSMENRATITQGEIQCMSAGTGVRHSEYNPSNNEEVHLLQIWIVPTNRLPVTASSYEQKSYQEALLNQDWVLVVCPVAELVTEDAPPMAIQNAPGTPAPMPIKQNCYLYVAKPKEAGSKKAPLGSSRSLWIQVVKGSLTVSDVMLNAGDGLALGQVSEVDYKWEGPAEFLVFDLPLP